MAPVGCESPVNSLASLPAVLLGDSADSPAGRAADDDSREAREGLLLSAVAMDG